MPEMKIKAPVYECDRCGACCEKLIIEIQLLDVIREPRLREVTKPCRVPPGAVYEDDDGNEITDPDPYVEGAILACVDPCPMLGADKLCQIYPSRPNVCVGFDAGSRKCQEAREMAKLPPLQPKESP